MGPRGAVDAIQAAVEFPQLLRSEDAQAVLGQLHVAVSGLQRRLVFRRQSHQLLHEIGAAALAACGLLQDLRVVQHDPALVLEEAVLHGLPEGVGRGGVDHVLQAVGAVSRSPLPAGSRPKGPSIYSS